MKIENKNYLNNFFIVFDFIFYYLLTLNFILYKRNKKRPNFIFITFLIYYYLI